MVTPVSSAVQGRDLQRPEPEDFRDEGPRGGTARISRPIIEQEHHHAELGDVQDGLGIGGAAPSPESA